MRHRNSCRQLGSYRARSNGRGRRAPLLRRRLTAWKAIGEIGAAAIVLDDRFHETAQLLNWPSIHGMRPFRASHRDSNFGSARLVQRSVAPDCLFSRINSLFTRKNFLFPIAVSLIPLAAMRAVRPDDDAVALACGSGGAHRRNRALAGTEERASAKFSAASSCGLSNILVQIENRTPDRPNFEPRRYNPCTVSIARRGRREFSPLATARPLKRLKTAMGGSCKSSGSAPHPLGVGAA